MRIVFTCACGNVAEIEAESLQLANMVACSSRWVLGTNYMADGSFQEYSRCPKCRENAHDEPRGSGEAGDQEVPR